ncbi:NfeD family protein [Glutamicibacter sp. MNS18]|uniref:NfeD family protein n=1 Tax=Glutamicibacter sp. MNS18 TaxID=2989817 RepID=UPI0022357352|nr:NfeD family protein [Glutamicibacter sp. MNS18]MCW4464882.1 NfeD family protein [Glutamicibacter sp. MNS18]
MSTAEWVLDNAWVIWLAAFLLLAIIEMLSLDLYFIMLGVGTLGGLSVALADGPGWLQVVVFGLVSLTMIFLVRPIAMRHLRRSPVGFRTNIERLIGKDALVLEPVSRVSGRAKIAGEVWTARTDANQPTMDPGTYAVVSRIDGATAYLKLNAEPNH